MWTAAVEGRTRSRGPVIPSHVPQRDQGKLAQSFPSIAFHSSSPALRSCRFSSLVLGAVWFGWHRGFTSIKLNQGRRNVGWTQGNYLPAIHMKQRVQETPQYWQPSAAASSPFTQLWALPEIFQADPKSLAKGLLWLCRDLSFLFTKQWCRGGQEPPFLLLADFAFLLPLSPEQRSAQFFFFHPRLLLVCHSLLQHLMNRTLIQD